MNTSDTFFHASVFGRYNLFNPLRWIDSTIERHVFVRTFQNRNNILEWITIIPVAATKMDHTQRPKLRAKSFEDTDKRIYKFFHWVNHVLLEVEPS